MTITKKYPFQTKRDVVGRLSSEPAFVTECADILEARTCARAAGNAPAGGWMSSQRVVAGRLVAALRAGTISDADRAKLQGMLTHYAKQIADHFRAEELRRHPELLETARLFSVTIHSAVCPATPTTLEKPAAAAVGAEGEPVADSAEEEPASEDAIPPPDLMARVLQRVREQPGSRTEEMAAWLGATTAGIGAAVRSLMAERKISKKGKARGTRYFVR